MKKIGKWNAFREHMYLPTAIACRAQYTPGVQVDNKHRSRRRFFGEQTLAGPANVAQASGEADQFVAHTIRALQTPEQVLRELSLLYDSRYSSAMHAALNEVPRDLVGYVEMGIERRVSWSNQAHFRIVISPHSNTLGYLELGY